MKEPSLSKVDFLLVVPYQEISNFAVQIIESYLQLNGYEVVILYFKERNQNDSYSSEREISLLIDFIKDVNPLLVGFTVMSPFFQIAKLLTKRIGEKIDVPIIWGGVHPTICPEDCIDIADICCIGEGEEPLRQILEHLKTYGRIDPNTQNCWINDGGNVVKNPITYRCEDLDSLPYPNLTGGNKYIINNNQIKNEDPYFAYILRTGKYSFKALRGCPFHCTYCGNKAIRDVYEQGRGHYLRKRSVDNVLGELKEIIEIFPNIKWIASYDETFISNGEYVKEFSEKYKKQINIPLTCCAVSSLLSDENVSMMAEAGLTGLNVGIEAFSEDVRNKVYRRKMGDAEIVEKAKMVHKYGVYMMYDFIYDNPLETEKDIADCFWNLIINLPRPCQFNNYSLSHLPKSELTELLLKEGRIDSNDVVGKSDKGLVQWKVTSNYTRDKKVLFWTIVYALYGMRIKFKRRSFLIPVCIIKFIARTRNYFLANILRRAVAIIVSLSEGVFMTKVRVKIRSAL